MCQQRISYLEVDLIAKKRLKYGLLSQVFINSLFNYYSIQMVLSFTEIKLPGTK